MAISFKKPPLNEVALGYTFLPRPDLLIPHIGGFWSEISDGYPRCQHAPPIVDSVAPGMEELPLPRVWFLSKDNASLVQLQTDRFIFNWRDTGAGNSYQRFPAVRSEFERVDALFRAYVAKVSGVDIHPTGYSLTYVNVIKQGDGWGSFSDIGTVFPDLRWHRGSRKLPAPTLVEWKTTFPLQDDAGTLNVHLQSAKMVKDNHPILRFELNAKSNALTGGSFDFENWVGKAHASIVESFKELTGEVMHNEHWLIEKG